MACEDTPKLPGLPSADADTVAADQAPKSAADGAGAEDRPARSPSQQRLADAVANALFSDAADPLARGAVFAGRYRIEQRLGEGGMGEVFRAHDLVLGEDVALKLLPPSLAARPGYHERFVREVRLARQVSHPSLCRVHDIGEADGRPFLSMEYVDGEDLQSLLRRIGRLGAEKALELSHQLCSGLAALHERGIIHRDLKPANIMLDGSGCIRIADFGLASIAEELGEHEIRDGTPAYQAPEQRAGREATSRSDVFALGLVLYEMFLGQRPTSVGARTSSASRSGIDPAVQSVIEQCLAEDPSERFADGLSVLVALPGGDPLAAALAAGRLPSPDAVANANVVGGLSPLVRRMLMGVMVASLVALAVLNATRSVLALDEGLLAPDVLRDRAAQRMEALEIADPATDVASLSYRRGWIRHFEAGDAPVAAVRESQESLVAFTIRGFDQLDGHGTTYARDEPVAEDGEFSFTLDGHARLLGLHWERLSEPESIVELSVDAAEPATDELQPPLEPSQVWEALFLAAALEDVAVQVQTQEFLPPVYGDTAAAWTGTVRGTPTQIHAVASRGRPVWFELVSEADQEPRVYLTGLPALAFLVLAFTGIAVLVVCVRVAISTVRRREGDFAGARTVGVLVVVLELSSWALASGPADWLSVPSWTLRALGLGVASWLGYLMLEPYARAHWPKTLVSWNRLLRARWRDPMVGRDLLVGTTAGCLMPLVVHADPRSLFAVHDLDLLMGPRFVLAWLPGTLSVALQATFCLYIALLGLHRIVRVRALALGLFLVFVPSMALVVGASPGTVMAFVVGGGVAAFMMLRFGMLAMAFFAFASAVALSFPITLNLGAWYASTGATGVLLLVTMGVLGARLCTVRVARPLQRPRASSGPPAAARGLTD